MLQQRLSLAAALVAAVALGACSGDSTGGDGPASITVSGGGNQPGVTWHDLKSPLEVTVTSQSGKPVSGAGVAWTVSGDADLDSATTHTSAAGRATNRLSIGETPGTVTVTATVGKLPAAHFTIVVTKPCDARIPLPYGSSVTEEIEALDCQLKNGSFVDLYTAATTTQRVMRVTESSTQVDPFVTVYSTAGEVLAYHDDISTQNLNSALSFLAPAGTYLLAAGSQDALDLGTYTLTAQDDADAGGCQWVWVMRGVSAAARAITPNDCAYNNEHWDTYPIVLKAGQTLTVTANSTAFDGRLELYKEESFGSYRVAQDDNSAGGTDPRLTFTPTETDLYYIYLYAKSGGTGAYTLTVQ